MLGNQALHELGPFLFAGLAPFMQQHLADLDSVGRRCATGLHKLGARCPVPLKTNAGDESRIGCGQARAKTEYRWRMERVAHTLILGEHKANLNSQDLQVFQVCEFIQV